MTGLSVHAVDVAQGRPAPALIAEGTLCASGALDHPITAPALEPGDYEVRLHVGAWLGPERAGILETIVFALRLCEPAQHCHLPFKVKPWGYSVFRGS